MSLPLIEWITQKIEKKGGISRNSIHINRQSLLSKCFKVSTSDIASLLAKVCGRWGQEITFFLLCLYGILLLSPSQPEDWLGLDCFFLEWKLGWAWSRKCQLELNLGLAWPKVLGNPTKPELYIYETMFR